MTHRPTTTCPTWCRADHAADMQRRREMAAEVDRQLGVPPGQGLLVDSYLLHQVEIGRMQVRVGRDEQPGLLRVTVEQPRRPRPAGPLAG